MIEKSRLSKSITTITAKVGTGPTEIVRVKNGYIAVGEVVSICRDDPMSRPLKVRIWDVQSPNQCLMVYVNLE